MNTHKHELKRFPFHRGVPPDVWEETAAAPGQMRDISIPPTFSIKSKLLLDGQQLVLPEMSRCSTFCLSSTAPNQHI